MRRLARFAAAATVVGSLLLTAAWTALALAQAVPPPSSCVANPTGPPFYTCTLEESLNGAQSELSTVVPLPPPGPAVPATMDIAFFENPALLPADRTNWSDVIEFSPPSPSNPNAPFGTVQFLSNGCASGPQSQTDISCFPAQATQPPIQEIQTGTGYDSQDCTPFQAIEPQSGIVYAVGQACSDAALNEPGANIPEVPMSFMLPVAALGIFGAAGLKRRRKAVDKPSAD
jgi:hypothetical protein